MGILTWMFVDGHGSGLMNYTPQPLMAPMIGLIIAVIWGLSTDYEVFLVSRMVEARERGMSTAEAIRIGTATTGRLITGAALVLAVVAGAFVFSDLVMMKYLAFGLLLALLLDATVVRMFLVPAIMKLLGDDCWWAPQLDEAPSGTRSASARSSCPTSASGPPSAIRSDALVGAGAPLPPRPRPPHDPTHPAVEGSSRPGAATTRIQTAPARTSGPSVAGTTRMRTQRRPRQASRRPPGSRPPRRKPRNAVNNANAAPQRAKRAAPPPPVREDREIESWLGELRGNGPRRGDATGRAEAPSAEGCRARPPRSRCAAARRRTRTPGRRADDRDSRAAGAGSGSDREADRAAGEEERQASRRRRRRQRR